MLGVLRRNSKSAIIYFLFAIIILVFVFTFNTGSGKGGGCTSGDVPVYVEVNGEELTSDDMYMGLQLVPSLVGTPDGMGLLMGMGVDIMALYTMDPEQLNPEQAAAIMDALQGIYLISDAAEEMGFSISETELAKAIYPESFFKDEEVEGEDGTKTTVKKFQQKQYANWVTYRLHSSTRRFEDYSRRVLLSRKMLAFFSGLVQVTDSEAQISAIASKLNINLEVAELLPVTFEGDVVIPSDLGQFIQEKDADISVYYDSHPKEFHSKKQVKMRVVLADGITSAEGEVNMAAAATAADELMARLAGDKELIPAPVPAEGEVAAEPPVKPEEPKDKIERFKALATHWSKHKESADRAGLMPGWKSEDDLIQFDLGLEEARKVIDAPKGEVVRVSGNQGVWLVLVEDVQDARDVSLENAKPEIAGKLYRQENAKSLAKAAADSFLGLAKASADKELDQLAKDADDQFKGRIRVRKTGMFAASTPRFAIPTVGSNEEIFNDGFMLETAAPVSGKVYTDPTTGKLFVVRLAEKQVPTKEEIAQADIDAARERLAIERDVAFFQAWFNGLKSKAQAGGDLSQTEEFQTFLQYLQNEREQRELKAAKKARQTAAN